MPNTVSSENGPPATGVKFTSHRLSGRKWLAVLTVVTWLPLVSDWPTAGQSKAVLDRPRLFLNAVDLLTEFSASGLQQGNAHEFIGKAAFGDSKFNVKNLLAFEENKLFACAVGEAPMSRNLSSAQAHGQMRAVRRVILLKPSLFVVDDEIEAPRSAGPVEWQLNTSSKPAMAGQRMRLRNDEAELLCETLLPQGATHRSRREPELGETVISTATPGKLGRVRFLHVIQIRTLADRSEVRSKLTEEGGQLQLALSTTERVFKLTLPPSQIGAGEISITRNDGKEVLARRFFPSGLLPHGPEGMKMLDLWDSSYRGENRPFWDAGQPSGELRRVVENGIVRACRTIDLGCGSGTDAIYLARQGFEVTAIDIAPTALSQGKEKADKAGVKVRWLLADVLSVPELEPFDFIFDRGCYHEVRMQDAKAYVETIRRLSRPGGTRFLLLAGNPNELPVQYAPPQVAEEDIRSDFSSLFDFEWLRETRFETSTPSAPGPLAWSAMLRRKGKP